jgi:hypothetical protein
MKTLQEVGLLDQHAVKVSVHGTFIIGTSRPCLTVISMNIAKLVDTPSPYIIIPYSL